MVVPSHQQRVQTADQLAKEHGWQRYELAAPPFVLTAYLPQQAEAARIATGPLTIYIEGDGLAWVTRSRISSDPTPIDPVGLRLALQHPSGLAAYLARPCQFTTEDENGACPDTVWTSARFSEQVITASDRAITALMHKTSATSLRLIGYSGGGAVAALVAARRKDVTQLITVAGNMDHPTWTSRHRISPLKDSLNPSEAWSELEDIPQTHLTGGQDHIMGREILAAYLKRFPAGKQPKTINFPNYRHSCCWVENWADIYWQATKQAGSQ